MGDVKQGCFLHTHMVKLWDVVSVVCCRDISGDDSSDKIAESRGAKKPRLVWTSELHARFMNAVNHLVMLPLLCNGLVLPSPKLFSRLHTAMMSELCPSSGNIHKRLYLAVLSLQ